MTAAASEEIVAPIEELVAALLQRIEETEKHLLRPWASTPHD